MLLFVSPIPSIHIKIPKLSVRAENVGADALGGPIEVPVWMRGVEGAAPYGHCFGAAQGDTRKGRPYGWADEAA